MNRSVDCGLLGHLHGCTHQAFQEVRYAGLGGLIVSHLAIDAGCARCQHGIEGVLVPGGRGMVKFVARRRWSFTLLAL